MEMRARRAEAAADADAHMRAVLDTTPAALEVPTILYAEESMINPVMTSKVEEAKAEAARARRREKAREAKAKKAARGPGATERDAAALVALRTTRR